MAAAATRERRTAERPSGSEAKEAHDSPAPKTESPPKPKSPPPAPTTPFLLDFLPLEGSDQTRLAAFYDRLRAGALSTTRCTKCGEVHWPPRVACPHCHAEELTWIDLPVEGTVYAFSAVLAGAPAGMEGEVPFAVGLVDLKGSTLRLFGRIDGKPWSELRVGERVRVVPIETGDGRMFYRFQTL